MVARMPPEWRLLLHPTSIGSAEIRFPARRRWPILKGWNEEDLAGRAAKTGEYVMNKLRALQRQNPIIGEVRGLGLRIGVEQVRDEKLTPASAEAEGVRDSLLRQ